MMVPPRTEPANSKGSPNTVIRATEFMLRWKTWAIENVLRGGPGGPGSRGRNGRAGLHELHKDPVRQLGGQKRRGGRGPGDQDAAQGVVQAAGRRPHAQQDAD